jgi:hypothetical protein
MKSSAACQKACLPTTLASLNNGHSSDLCACCAGVRSSSRPSFVPIRPLCPPSTAWRSSFVANLSNTAPGHAFAVEGGGPHSHKLLPRGGNDLGT